MTCGYFKDELCSLEARHEIISPAPLLLGSNEFQYLVLFDVSRPSPGSAARGPPTLEVSISTSSAVHLLPVSCQHHNIMKGSINCARCARHPCTDDVAKAAPSNRASFQCLYRIPSITPSPPLKQATHFSLRLSTKRPKYQHANHHSPILGRGQVDSTSAKRKT